MAGVIALVGVGVADGAATGDEDAESWVPTCPTLWLRLKVIVSPVTKPLAGCWKTKKSLAAEGVPLVAFVGACRVFEVCVVCVGAPLST